MFDRTTELRAFLTASRQRLHPRDVGLPVYRDRRRSLGLRREEVSTLANVSLTWYSWFESGRRTDVSSEFLERLACVLRLSTTETEYLFALAGLRSRVLQSHLALRKASEKAQRIVNGFTAGPALVVDHRYNILAWNPICAAWFGYDKPPSQPLNLLGNFFATERAKRVHADWDNASKQIVGTFRLEFAKHIEDPVYRDIVGSISQASREFQDLWSKQFVATWPDSFSFVLPEIGREITTQFAVAGVVGEPDEKIHLHTLPDVRLVRRIIGAAALPRRARLQTALA